MEVETDAPADLRRTLETLWRRKTWVIGAVAIAVLVSLGLSLRSTKIYAASAQVQLPDVVQTSIVSEQQLNLGDPEQVAAVQVSIAESERVSREVARTLGPRYGDVDSVDVQPIDENTAMSIEVRSSVPSVAQDGANAYANAYVAERQDLVTRLFTKRAERLDVYAAGLQQRAAALQIRLDQLDADIAVRQLEEPTPERESQLAPLRSERAQVFTEREALSANIEQALQRADEWRLEAQSQTESTADIITPATLPSNPISPTPIRDAVIAAAIGLVLGLGLVFGREALEGTVGNADDAERLLPDVPVLGSTLELSRHRHRWGHLRSRLFRRPVTRSAPGSPVVLADPSSAMAEAYRTVRTGLELVVDGGVVLVTSPAPVDGKTTTAVNLAASLAIDGKRVVLISGDLRRPRLHEHFGLPNNLGVTSVLQGRATVDEVLQQAPGAPEGLEILVAGPLPQNPAELLSSPAAGDLFAALSARSDYVIVDSPPVLAVTDAVVTAQWTDAVVLVARQRFTARRSLASAADLLRQARANLAGVILAGVAPSRRSPYSYYYHAATAGSVDGVGSAPSIAPTPTPGDNGATTSQGMKTTPDPEPAPLHWPDSAEAGSKLIENGWDLDEASGLVRLGTVPLLRGAQGGVAKEQAMAAVRDSYRAMRANVASLGDSETIGSILVTCAGIMEHKSYMVANLSGAFAEEGSTVIALSCDWRHSQLHRLYGLPGDIGFTDVIDGMSPSQALRPVGFDGRFMVMASGSEPPNLSEFLGSSRVVAALRDISLNCDVLVVDGAPVLEDPGVLALSPALDTTVLVATVGITTMGDLSSAVAAVKESGARRLGTVLTGVHANDVKV